MSLLKVNLQLGKQAIQYLKKLGITSNNVSFRFTSYLKSPLGTFDSFLLFYMRSETKLGYLDDHVQEYQTEVRKLGFDVSTSDARKYIRGQILHAKDVRTQILEILHSNATKQQKKARLKQIMQEVGFKPLQTPLFTFKSGGNYSDEARIRSARKAIKFKHGNCGEKSAIAATWLLENTKNTKAIYWVNATNWDHAWVVMGERGKIDVNDILSSPIDNWDENTVIVDGWTEDYYAARHPYNPIKSGSIPNPFQLAVRRKIQKAATQLNVMEELRWPPRFSPDFTLQKAAKPNSTYETRRFRSDSGSSYSDASIEELADDWGDLVQELIDLKSRQ